MRLFNTPYRLVEELRPIEPGLVTIYTCGPTVYSNQHIGNLRTYVFADLLKRALHLEGYRTFQVMNVTDVGHLTDDADQGEDKVEKAARALHQDPLLLTERYKDRFFLDCGKLNILPPDVICRATDHIREQIDLIAAIEARGHTYRTEDGVYFDTASFETFTPLDNMAPPATEEYSRVGAGQKRNPSDFALWKFSPSDRKRQLEWDSPWGVGFPGWHIECSAMSMEYLGDRFDIHTGGIDHIPVHHTSEIRQMESAVGHRVVSAWCHGGWLFFDFDEDGDPSAQKMSKSAGKTVLLSDLERRGIPPLAFRLLLLTAHYQHPLRASWASLEQARRSYEKLRARAAELPDAGDAAPSPGYAERFKQAASENLDTPGAVALTWELLRDKAVPDREKAATLDLFDGLLGLDLLAAATNRAAVEIPSEVLTLVQERAAARAARDWATADRLRERLGELGYEVRDEAKGYVLTRA